MCGHMGVSKNGGIQNDWFILENSIKVDDLRVPLFQETLISVFQTYVILLLVHDYEVLRFSFQQGYNPFWKTFLTNQHKETTKGCERCQYDTPILCFMLLHVIRIVYIYIYIQIYIYINE